MIYEARAIRQALVQVLFQVLQYVDVQTFITIRCQKVRKELEKETQLRSGIPSSWFPRKLRFVMHEVLRKSLRLPKATLQSKERHKTFIAQGKVELFYRVPLM